MNKIMLLAAFAFVTLAGWGGANELSWRGGDGAWNDPNMWSPNRVPTSADHVFFTGGRGGRVLVDGAAEASYVFVGEDGKVEDEIAPVEFYGGGTITMCGAAMQAFGGRHVVVTNVTIDSTGKGFYLKCKDGIGGSLEIRSGGACIGASSRNYVYAGSEIFINGGKMSGNLTLFTGATFRMSDGTYEFLEKAPTINDGCTVDISGGNVISKPGFDEPHSAFFDRSGAVTTIKGATSLYDLDAVRVLPRELHVTNENGNASLVAYSNMTFLGREVLDVDSLQVRNKSILQLKTPELRVRDSLHSPASGAEIDLHGDTLIKSRGGWTASNGMRLMSDGAVELDTDDADGGAAHALDLMRFGFDANGSLEVTGAGSVDKLLFADSPSEASVPRSLKLPSFGAPCWTHCISRGASIFFRDIEIGANEEIMLPCRNSVHASSNSSYNAFCKSTVDPTVHFDVLITTNGFFDSKGKYNAGALSAGSLYAVFLGGAKSDWLNSDQFSLVSPDGNPESLGNWQLRFVGPMAYLSDGTLVPSTGNGYWCGAVSGYTSDAKNWCNEDMTASAAYFVGEDRNVVTNDLPDWKQKGFRTNTTTGPFVLRGNAITLNRDAANLGTSSSFYHNGGFPFLFEAPMKLASGVTKLTFVVNTTSRLALTGAMDFTGASVGLGGDIQVGSTFVCKSIWFGLKGKDTEWGRANALTVLEDATMTVSGQDDCLTNGIFIVQGGGKLEFAGGEFAWGGADRVNTVDGVIDFQVPLSGACSLGFSGTGVVNVASVRSAAAGNASVLLDGKLKLVPSADWTTVTSEAADRSITLTLPKWGRATLAPVADFTYGPASGITPTTDAATRAFACGDLSELTVDSDHAVAFADPLVFGEHAKLVKKGTGRMTVSAADVLPETVELKSGTLALAAPKAVARFVASGGATLELAAGASLNVTEDNVSLDGLTIVPPAGAADWTPLMTVAKWRTFAGEPSFSGGDYRVKLVSNGDGTTSLAVKEKTGLMLILR